ncbi:MAG: hypothetical protein GX946_11730 [Oligosphaeraceae bacterium]|nr:hypothetical protein [Oligosphaeraceae bacterium]
MNIMLVTLGATWAILPELLGFTNPEQFHFYQNHPDKERFLQTRENYGIKNVDEIWLLIIDNNKSRETVEKCKIWLDYQQKNIPLKVFYIEHLEDVRSAEDCRKLKELIYRATLKAESNSRDGLLLISMAGGYRTMGSDMQSSASIFGCHALMYVLLTRLNSPPLIPENSCSPDAEAIKDIIPIVVASKQPKATYLYDDSTITTANFPLKEGANAIESCQLLEKIEQLQKQSGVILTNFTGDRGIERNFRAFTALHPQIIEKLKDERIGCSKEQENEDLKWLRKLPKAELHCHFGGILDPEDMIQVAFTEEEEVEKLAQKHEEFATWRKDISNLVDAGKLDDLRKLAAAKDDLRRPFKFVKEPFGVCAFLMAFKEHKDLLEKVIYGEYLDPCKFAGIGIEEYEKLGDLQGSALMQSKRCIESACKILREKCRKENIKYLELRCSPVNYTRGGLTGSDVVRILFENLRDEVCSDCIFAFIFIASRHGKMSQVYRHIELAEELLDGDEKHQVQSFPQRFVGFDLAGTESARSPRKLRYAFEALHERCIKLTIHAGETASADSIWQAVYDLNADRIGHGLKLLDNPDLLDRFVDRRIGVEMCPSSNFQICHYKDFILPSNDNSKENEDYPLRDYLDKHLLVSINTDNPGISRSSLSREFLKAAQMSKGGLSRLDIMQLLHNSFNSAFTTPQERFQLIQNSEKQIIELLKELYA